MRRHKILLDESEHADALVQRPARPADAAAAGAAPGHRAAGRAGRPGAAVPDGPDPAGGLAASSTSTSPARCSTSTGCGGRARCSARTGWRRRSARRRGSTTSTRASPRPARTSRTPRCRRRSTTRKAGITKLTTETGAGQWGTALAFACAQFDLECEVWQVRASYDQKPYRRIMIETFGGTVHPSPSRPDRGRAARSSPQHPDSTGSLGHRDQRGGRGRGAGPDTNYALGSVLNHVLLHQTVIGEEALLQLAQGRARPRTCWSAAPAAARTSAG